MTIIKAHNLACPLDGQRLHTRDKQLVCTNGHTFDISRQGYVNLLPVQHKRAKHPGDSKAMVLARSRFLNSGLYEPVANALSEIAFSYIADNKEICLLDAGCGEGYYLDAIYKYISHNNFNSELSFIGLDISKAAITESAKRNKQITWVVGTNRQPPIEDSSVDIILCVFGFQSFDGFNKILKPGGKIILVEPGPEHLQELRQIIYPDVKKSDPQDLSYAKETGFSLVDKQQLHFKITVTSHAQINDLLIMTPHFYRATKEGKESAEKLQELDITVDVVVKTLDKDIRV